MIDKEHDLPARNVEILLLLLFNFLLLDGLPQVVSVSGDALHQCCEEYSIETHELARVAEQVEGRFRLLDLACPAKSFVGVRRGGRNSVNRMVPPSIEARPRLGELQELDVISLLRLLPLDDGACLRRGPGLDAEVDQRSNAEVFSAWLARALRVSFL